jgi:hypothetical protein
MNKLMRADLQQRALRALDMADLEDVSGGITSTKPDSHKDTTVLSADDGPCSPGPCGVLGVPGSLRPQPTVFAWKKAPEARALDANDEA